jgi:hypothetical protein
VERWVVFGDEFGHSDTVYHLHDDVNFCW